MAANVPLAAGCFGGLGALHLFLLVRLALADMRRDRAADLDLVCGGHFPPGTYYDNHTRKIVLPGPDSEAVK
jgi:hypothetical protein